VVIARVLSVALFAALLWSRAFRRIPLQAVGVGLGKLLRASLPVSLAWFLCLLNSGIDPLIIGASSPSEVVGVYGFAYFVALLASTVLIPPVGRVAYAALITYRDDPERAFTLYRLATLVLLAAEVPVALFLFVNADTVLGIMGGDRWLGGAPYLRILCFVPLADPFSRFGGDLLLTRHEDRRWILSAAVTLAWFLTAGIALTHALGPTGMALADLLPLGGLVMAQSVRRASPRGFASLCRALAFVYLAPLPFYLAAGWLGGERPALRFTLSLAAGLLTALVYYARLGGDFRAFFHHREPGPGLQSGAPSGDTRQRGGEA
jgi:O-antigen/teichoic acid export membrane protein